MLRRLLKRIAIVLVAFVAALAAAELVLRIFDPFHTAEVIEREAFQRAILEPDPVHPQAILRAGAHATFLGHECVVNSHRMRGPEVPFAKPPGVYRIVVAGDSVAFGWGVEERDSFPRVLERMLNDGPKPEGIERFEVINGSTPGWGIPNYLLFLKESGLRFAPDLVLVTLINNDLVDIIRAVAGETAGGGSLLQLPEWAKRFYLARAIKDAHDISAGAQGDVFVELEAEPALMDPAIDRACDALAAIARLCSPVPVIVFDTLTDASGGRFDRLVACLDSRHVQRIEGLLPRDNYMQDYALTPIDMHPNVRGHRELAELVYAWLRGELLK